MKSRGPGRCPGDVRRGPPGSGQGPAKVRPDARQSRPRISQTPAPTSRACARGRPTNTHVRQACMYRSGMARPFTHCLSHFLHRKTRSSMCVASATCIYLLTLVGGEDSSQKWWAITCLALLASTPACKHGKIVDTIIFNSFAVLVQGLRP